MKSRLNKGEEKIPLDRIWVILYIKLGDLGIQRIPISQNEINSTSAVQK